MKNSKPADSKQKKGRRCPSLISRLLPWLFIIAGIILLARPVVTDWYYTWEAEQSIQEIVSVYTNMDDPERLENLDQARAFNARQVGQHYEMPAGGIWEYAYQLTYRSTPKSMMAWIDIPRIGTKLPIYHGTGEAELMAGVGHAEWSALPVGGEGMRCVLTAHSGMTGTRMFDDIRVLEPGDTFVLWALGEPYAYEVVEIETVLPEDAPGRCRPIEGRDLCTLITCTPYGINSHRLLVTGERCEYVGDETVGVEAYVNRRTIPLIIGLFVLFFLLLLLFIGLLMGMNPRHIYLCVTTNVLSEKGLSDEGLPFAFHISLKDRRGKKIKNPHYLYGKDTETLDEEKVEKYKKFDFIEGSLADDGIVVLKDSEFIVFDRLKKDTAFEVTQGTAEGIETSWRIGREGDEIFVATQAEGMLEFPEDAKVTEAKDNEQTTDEKKPRGKKRKKKGRPRLFILFVRSFNGLANEDKPDEEVAEPEDSVDDESVT